MKKALVSALLILAGSHVFAGVCGNNVVEMGEVCDGSDLLGFTRVSDLFAGYSGGTLKCKPDCSGFDVSAGVKGNVIAANSCSQEDVQAAIDAAKDGDTVTVPEGSCIWTKTIAIGHWNYKTKNSEGKSIVLQGAGSEKTFIQEKIVAIPGAINSALAIAVEFKKPVRLTGFTIDGTYSVDNFGGISIQGKDGTLSFVRVDHSTFTNVTERAITIDSAYALIDHNTFVRTTSGAYNPTLISISNWGDHTGDDAWTRPQDLGTINDVYMEDNTFIHSITSNGPFDAYTGARLVFRHNKLYGSHLGNHGFDSAYRGTPNYEIYENICINMSPTGVLFPHDTLIEMRSGTGVFFNNKMIKPANATADMGTYDQFLLVKNYRSYLAFSQWPNAFFKTGCDGSNPYDGNMLDLDTNGDGINDTSSGYPCRDQIGRTGGTNALGFQTLSPIFSWNNDLFGNVGGHVAAGDYAGDPTKRGTTYHVLENRDFYNGGVTLDAASGMYSAKYKDDDGQIKDFRYKPYPYPHPLIVTEMAEAPSPGSTQQSPPPSTGALSFADFNTVFTPSRDGSLAIVFNPGASASVSLKVFDRHGRLVKKLIDGDVSSGLHTIEWDGRDSQGQKVSSGSYVLQLKGDSGHATKKVVVIK